MYIFVSLTFQLIISAKEVMFLAGFVCLFMGLFASNINSKTYGQILMKFSGNVRNRMKNN